MRPINEDSYSKWVSMDTCQMIHESIEVVRNNVYAVANVVATLCLLIIYVLDLFVLIRSASPGLIVWIQAPVPARSSKQ